MQAQVQAEDMDRQTRIRRWFVRRESVCADELRVLLGFRGKRQWTRKVSALHKNLLDPSPLHKKAGKWLKPEGVRFIVQDCSPKECSADITVIRALVESLCAPSAPVQAIVLSTASSSPSTPSLTRVFREVAKIRTECSLQKQAVKDFRSEFTTRVDEIQAGIKSQQEREANIERALAFIGGERCVRYGSVTMASLRSALFRQGGVLVSEDELAAAVFQALSRGLVQSVFGRNATIFGLSLASGDSLASLSLSLFLSAVF